MVSAIVTKSGFVKVQEHRSGLFFEVVHVTFSAQHPHAFERHSLGFLRDEAEADQRANAVGRLLGQRVFYAHQSVTVSDDTHGLQLLAVRRDGEWVEVDK